MKKNQKQNLITFCVNRIEFGPENKALVKDMYDIYLRYCLVENGLPVEKPIFVKFILDYVKDYHFACPVSYVQDTEEPYFLKIRVMEDPRLDVYKQQINILEEKAKKNTLTDMEQEIRKKFKFLRYPILSEEEKKSKIIRKNLKQFFSISNQLGMLLTRFPKLNN